jgi:methyl-accepting chemotaxis protein
MKTQRTRQPGYLALAIALTGLFAMGPAASAQYRDRDRRGTLSNTTYEQIRQWAHDLDEVARHASEQAQARQAGYKGFRRDTKFLKSIDHFADRAERFHERIDSYRTQPWDVDEEIEHLIRDARNVQTRLRRARFVDQHTAADWNQVIRLLNQMSTEYRAGIGSSNRYPTGDYRADPYPNTGDYRTDPHPNPGDHHGDRSPTYGTYGNSTDLRQLAAELDQRAARASQLASGYSGYSSDIRHFSEQARDFRNQVETNRMSRSELRSEVNHLLEDAQTAYSELRQRNVTREVAREWDAIVQILTRMRDLAV